MAKLLGSTPAIQPSNQADPRARETYRAIIHTFPAGKVWHFGSAVSLSPTLSLKKKMIKPLRDFYYKYVTAETALAILTNSTFQYSSPDSFNDPFDTQTEINYGFTYKECTEALDKEIYKLIHNHTAPFGLKTHPLFTEIMKMWLTARKSSDKLPFKMVQPLLEILNKKQSSVYEYSLKELNNLWKLLSKHSKIFCVSKKHTNLLMWAHYAKDHTGIVFKLKCLPKIDTVLCAAKKVEYQETPPVIAKLDEYIKYITGQTEEPDSYNTILEKMFVTKSDHWKYEEEYRVFIPPANMEELIADPSTGVKKTPPLLLQFKPEEIDSIYFGCNILSENKDLILDHLTKHLPHVKKFMCSQNKKEYKLDFSAI